MTYILKKTESHYHLLSNKRAEFAQYSIASGKLEQIGKMSDKSFPWIEGRPLVIASTKQVPGLAALNVAAIKILLGEADTKAMAAKWALDNVGISLAKPADLTAAFTAGYNKCLEVNADKRFTIDDMAKLIRWLSTTGKFLHAPTGNLSGNRAIVEEFLKSQKTAEQTEWKVQIEMDHTPQALPEHQYVPKITNGQITLLKIIP